jgi:hypothetical protein
MRIYRKKNVHIQKRASINAHFFLKCAIRKLSSTSVYAHFPSLYAHFGFRKCAFTEAKMRIYEREIYGNQNVHIWKILPYMRILASINAHFGFRICTFFPSCMRIYGRQKCAFRRELPYMCILEIQCMHIYRSQFHICIHLWKLITSINVHIWKQAYTKVAFLNVHLWKLDFVNAHL